MGPDHTAFGRDRPRRVELLRRRPVHFFGGGIPHHSENPDGVEKGAASVACNGRAVDGLIPARPAGSVNEVTVIMGRREKT